MGMLREVRVTNSGLKSANKRIIGKREKKA
jgi:hypothetical protein